MWIYESRFEFLDGRKIKETMEKIRRTRFLVSRFYAKHLDRKIKCLRKTRILQHCKA